ncbi:MAG: ABC transporter ATP-binding protein/permease [Acetatifactor sp.]|nr:ABC transporter ATP-binding protein/permease [Acetatifactor sp.]
MLLLEAASDLVYNLQIAIVNQEYMKRFFSYFDIPNHMYQGSLTVEKRDDNDYNVEFRDVSFRYPHTQEYALRHVNLKFKAGEKLAVVGMNGSGKTTFIKLMCRLYDPTEGEILLNGVNIKKYDYEEYISIFSVVFQDFRLFSFTLGQNVAAGTVYDETLVRQCLEQAGFGERLESMGMGLDTCLYKDCDENGVEISGGEAQKIALARALYKDAPFMILDEPTAALDPISEYEVFSRFNEIAKDKTAIYISHRLASCRFCDKIAVFDEGRIVQTGSHGELLAQEGGRYYELWHAQAQYYTSQQ